MWQAYGAYDFEWDMVGAAPSNITFANGSWIVVSASSGQAMSPVSASTGASAFFGLDLFPSATHYAVTWKENYITAGRGGVILRGHGSNSIAPGVLQGYLFQASPSAGHARIYTSDATNYTQLSSVPLAARGSWLDRWYRATVKDDLLTFEYSDDGSTFTQIMQITDATYANAGTTQYARGFGQPVSGVGIDDVSFTPIQYLVTFQDRDMMTVISTWLVDHGLWATAPANPTRTGYTFSGWNMNFSTITGDLTVTAEYTINQYTLTFDADGWDPVNPITDDYGTGVTAPTTTKTGYVFSGWNPSVPTTMPASSGNYIAQWTPIMYQVAYDANSGMWMMTSQDFAYDTAENLTTNSFTKTGYSFSGWNDQMGWAGTRYIDAQSVNNLTTTSGAIVTLYAQWTINQYTLTFDADGWDPVNPITDDYGTGVTAPTTTKTGYVFSGWNPSVPTTMPASSGNYIAQWTPIMYQVAYDANSGMWMMTSQDFAYDTAENLTTNSFTKTGYSFSGWNDQMGWAGTRYIDAQSVNNLTTTSGAIVTLYAQWTINQYTLTFDADGWDPVNPITDDYGTGVTAPTTTKTGYVFSGWNPSVPTTMPASSGNYIAQWTPIMYQVAYDANSGMWMMTSQDFAYDTAENLTTNSFTKTGYSFSGWNDQMGWAGTRYIDAQSVNNLTTTSGAIVTLYAQWTINQYTLTFDADGWDPVNPITDDYGTGVTAPTTTKTGYVFSGWNPSVPTTMPASSGNYIAQWTPIMYQVAYDANSGMWMMTSQDFAYDTAENLTTNSFTKTGYSFSGWNDQMGWAGTRYIDAQSVNNLTTTSGAIVTLYAQWTINQYTLTFDADGWDPVNPITDDYGTGVTAPTTTKTGYVFSGWNPSVPTTMPASSGNYIAQWTDINECLISESNICNDNATCTNTIGSYTCACNAGYIGDGESCTICPAGTKQSGNQCVACAANETSDAGSVICTVVTTYGGTILWTGFVNDSSSGAIITTNTGADVINWLPLTGDTVVDEDAVDNTTDDAVQEDTEMVDAFIRSTEEWVNSDDLLQTWSLYGILTRGELAVLISNFMRNILNKPYTFDPACKGSLYADYTSWPSNQSDYIEQACSLGVMGRRNADGAILEAFRASDPVTRAEFATVLSRVLYGDQYNGDDGGKRYAKHLQVMNDNGYINDISNPFMNEIRWFALIIMYRISN
jgi:uncharacterized repeat protein (TIGR02543 family)